MHMCRSRDRGQEKKAYSSDKGNADELLNLKELDLEQTRLIINIGNMVIDEKVDKASITLQGSTITVKGGDKIKVQRNAKTTTSKEV